MDSRFFRRVVFVYILLVYQLAVADGIANSETLIIRAAALELSQHKVWRKLLHYETSIGSTEQVVSAVHDPTFFNAKNGKTNPTAELNATLRGFFLTQSKDANQLTQCRFPARYLWLKKQLQLSDKDLPTATCPDFNKWTFGNEVGSISIVYASGYLENPATYYGHTLLKLNSKNEREKSKLLDQSVNYGVIVPDKEDPLSYILKSLFGGYDGGFSNASYHFHTQNYGEIELRDLWEYEFNLNRDEVDFVVAHAWEVLNRRYTYYFFRENCAYRLAELFEIIEDIDIIPSNPFYTLPRSVLQVIAASNRHNEPLIRAIDFYPSRQSRLYEKFSALTSAEKKIVSDVAWRKDNFDSESFKSLPITSRQVILDTLLDYYQFAEKSETLSIEDSNIHYQRVLSERFKLPPGEMVLASPTVNAPHKGRNASLLSLGVTYNTTFGEGISIRLRPTYYDALDTDAGHVSDSSLAMGEVKLLIKDDKLKIRKIDIFKLESVNHGITGLPGDSGNAWKLKLGLQQQNLSCFDCLALKFEGDYGYTARPFPKILIGTFFGGGIQDNRQSSGNLFLKTSVFSHIRLTEQLNLGFLAELPKQIDGSGGGETLLSLEARFKLDTNTDLRFHYEKNTSADLSVSFGYYF